MIKETVDVEAIRKERNDFIAQRVAFHRESMDPKILEMCERHLRDDWTLYASEYAGKYSAPVLQMHDDRAALLRAVQDARVNALEEAAAVLDANAQVLQAALVSQQMTTTERHVNDANFEYTKDLAISIRELKLPAPPTGDQT